MLRSISSNPWNVFQQIKYHNKSKYIAKALTASPSYCICCTDSPCSVYGRFTWGRLSHAASLSRRMGVFEMVCWFIASENDKLGSWNIFTHKEPRWMTPNKNRLTQFIHQWITMQVSIIRGNEDELRSFDSTYINLFPEITRWQDWNQQTSWKEDHNHHLQSHQLS